MSWVGSVAVVVFASCTNISCIALASFQAEQKLSLLVQRRLSCCLSNYEAELQHLTLLLASKTVRETSAWAAGLTGSEYLLLQHLQRGKGSTTARRVKMEDLLRLHTEV